MRIGLTLFLALLAARLANPALADPRVVVDPNKPPWNAVAKVQTNVGGRCTGVLIGPAVVLTAAHCLLNPRTRAMLQPVSLHVLFGYEHGDYRWHRLITRVTVGAGFDRLWPRGQASDWARLELAEAVPIKPLPIAGRAPPQGTAVMLAGYNQDRAQVMMAAIACRLRYVGNDHGGALPMPGAILMTHDCAGTRGTSGAPLMVRQGDGWAVVGINIAAGRESNLALRPPIAE